MNDGTETYLGVILQINGLAFFVMGVAALMARHETKGTGLAIHLGWLAAFGMLYGTQEFIDGERLQNPAPWLPVLSTTLMVVSFLALLEFGRRLCNMRSRRPRLAALPLYAVTGLGIVGLVLVAPTAQAGLEFGARYLLGATGGLLTGIGLFARARTTPLAPDTRSIVVWLRTGALAMLGYAALTLLLSPDSGRFVAAWLPTTSDFRAVTGLPAELARALPAMLLAIGFVTIAQRSGAITTETLARVTDNLNGFVYRCRNDRDWTVTFMSEGCESLTGHSAAAFLRGEVHFAGMIHPDDRESVWDEVQAALALNHDYRLEYRIVDRTGVHRWCYEEGRGVFGAQGELLFLEGYVRDDQPRRRSESARRQMKALLEASPQSVGWADPDGTVRYCNPALRRLLAVPDGADVSRYHLRDFYDERALSLIESTVLPTVVAHGEWTGEVDLRTLDGRTVPTLHSVFVLFDDAGEMEAFASSITDLSDIRRVERDLLIKDAAIATSQSAIALATPDGSLNYVNQAFINLWGLSGPEEALGHSALEFWVEPDQAAAVMDALARAGRWQGDLRARRADGSLADVELTGHMVFDAHGDPVCMMGSFLDVTERRKTEERIRASEASLSRAQRIAKLGGWELDIPSGKLLWTEEVYRLFEREPGMSSPTYEAFLEVVHPEDREKVNDAYIRSLQDQQPYQISHRLLMPDGRLKWVEERCDTEFAPDGTPLVSRGTVQEITERVKVQETLRGALAEKEMLLKEIHHRVKNNLQVVSSLLYFQSKNVSDPAAHACLEEARDRLRPMALVHEKLYATKDLARVDFADYVRTLVNQLTESHQRGGTRVRFTVAATPVQLSLECAAPVGMILAELVTNVLKHAYRRDEEGVCIVRVARADGDVVLTVSDGGKGLPERFDQVSDSSFGWQLIRMLTAQLDGRLTVGRERGTTVTLSFPHEPPELESRGEAGAPRA